MMQPMALPQLFKASLCMRFAMKNATLEHIEKYLAFGTEEYEVIQLTSC